MSTLPRDVIESPELTPRERELGAIINSYNEVTDQLKQAHDRLRGEVGRLREELTRKNRHLRRRERLAALGEMAAGVAHEIRNPLGGIQLFASLLAEEVADRPNAVRLVGKITKGVRTLEGIVTGILEFGRPAAPTPSAFALDQLVRETVELAAARIGQSQVTVEVSSDLAGVEMLTDGRLLQRALLNLLFNAVEAISQGGKGSSDGRVVIGLREGSGDRLTLTVNDNGPGMPADLMDKIFNPFFTTKDSGIGLGLSIVHQIAEMLGGSVQAANRREGGAVFSLCLPRRMPTPAGDEEVE